MRGKLRDKHASSKRDTNRYKEGAARRNSYKRDTRDILRIDQQMEDEYDELYELDEELYIDDDIAMEEELNPIQQHKK
ncbi:MAG TPA: hypothetical protein VL461_01855 [Dictyobacter sp.]|jgi:hypothetical protein|nr:hypothetical protein [Dictyobacter sp.]